MDKHRTDRRKSRQKNGHIQSCAWVANEIRLRIQIMVEANQ